MVQDLFRQEVMELQGESLWSSPSAVSSLRLSTYIAIAVLCAAAAGIWLCTVHYARKQYVAGRLTPSAGEVKVVTPHAGTVSSVRVREGDAVRAGDTLLVVETLSELDSGGDLAQVLLGEVERQLNQAQADIGRTRSLGKLELERIRAEREGLRRELGALERQHKAHRQRVQVSQRRLERMGALRARSLVSDEKFDEELDAHLGMENSAREYDVQRATRERQLDALRAEAAAVPVRTQESVAKAESQISELRQRQAELAGGRELALRAKVDGVVAYLGARVGESVKGQAVLAAIVPADAELEAELFVPSRAIGFIKTGQAISLRYDAFPYERYGVHAARVMAIAQTSLAPGEIGSALPAGEPVYRVRAAIDAQSIAAAGAERRLQAGMTLTATLTSERRSLIGWLVDPLQKLRTGLEERADVGPAIRRE